MDRTKLKDPEIARNVLFYKGYCKLPLGSYATWILKDWHTMFLRKNLVRKKYPGIFVTVLPNLKEFVMWMQLHDDYVECRSTNRELTEYQYRQIDSEGLIPKPTQLSVIA